MPFNPNVLFVCSEVFPLIKTGGLADVSGALPVALKALGADTRVLLPAYPTVLSQLSVEDTGVSLSLLPGVEHARILRSHLPDTDVPIYLLDCPRLYAREGGPYHDNHKQDWPDNDLRFGALSKAAALMCTPDIGARLGFQPHILHCNDWQTGLAPAYCVQLQQAGTLPDMPITIFSIHNMAYQGVFAPQALSALGLPWDLFHVDGLEYYGLLSFLKAGIYYSDWVTTVSPTYAQEIQTVEFGYGLEGLLSVRHTHLTGILNGIDESVWNPATDPHLSHHYSVDDLSGKQANKAALRERLGLETHTDKPLIGMIARMAHQKGMDLVRSIAPQIVQEGAQLAIVGSGDHDIEHGFQILADALPESISVTIGYDETLAHQIEAGADLFLMPSRFEPCGLNQMYSMRYGTLPIVRYTGGLADTVVDTTPANLAKDIATGFVFNKKAEALAVLQCIQRALLLYRDQNTWAHIQETAMRQDFSWKHSAQQYLELYHARLDAAHRPML